MLKIGDNAPDFTMLVGENNNISLSKLAGKFVVLYFYPKDDTPGCTVEARGFSQLKLAFEKLNTIIIGVSKDDLNAHDKFKKKYSLEFDLASDFNSNTCENYGVWEEKSIFGKKYMSIGRTTFLIDTEGKIAHIWRKVQVKGHAEEVLKQIENL
ncbi:thioredoxin-dependent thiol peroxidase [Candidatus Tisiphia endosymbiont of Beris chalybata]|uniref:thioredoxin-dependent thiol peroxidase n=1 Tax=Candidatus Tisiphia endosymbiont of Beris chalybata TaxID=3066262 RepID=UPI00312C780F